MTENPWYSFYVGDYARKTAHLSLLEHGAYRLLLDHYYATRQPLPNDSVKLCRICRARSPSERKSVMLVVAEFFTQDGTLLRHERCDSEVDKLLKYSDRQSAAAKQRHSQAHATAKPRARAPQPQPQSEGSGAKAPSPCGPPDWVPLQDWQALMEIRKEKKAVDSPRAIELLIAKLAELKAKGQSPAEVLQQSITNGWKGVFELKNTKPSQQKPQQQYANRGTL